MYDQGQVSTSIYYQNDKYGWPKTIRSEKGGQPEIINRTKGFEPHSILQYDQRSNEHLPERKLTLSHAIPLGVKLEHQLQEPFRFFVGDVKRMSTREKVALITDNAVTSLMDVYDGVDQYLIGFHDGQSMSLPKLSFNGNSISPYERYLTVGLGYLDVYFPERNAAKFEECSRAGFTIERMIPRVLPYYQTCIEAEKEIYNLQDSAEATFVVSQILEAYAMFNLPAMNVVRINNFLDALNRLMKGVFLTRTTAYFIFRLLPRFTLANINQTSLQFILKQCIPFFTAPRPAAAKANANVFPNERPPPPPSAPADAPSPPPSAPTDAPPQPPSGPEAPVPPSAPEEPAAVKQESPKVSPPPLEDYTGSADVSPKWQPQDAEEEEKGYAPPNARMSDERVKPFEETPLPGMTDEEILASRNNLMSPQSKERLLNEDDWNLIKEFLIDPTFLKRSVTPDQQQEQQPPAMTAEEIAEAARRLAEFDEAIPQAPTSEDEKLQQKYGHKTERKEAYEGDNPSQKEELPQISGLTRHIGESRMWYTVSLPGELKNSVFPKKITADHMLWAWVMSGTEILINHNRGAAFSAAFPLRERDGVSLETYEIIQELMVKAGIPQIPNEDRLIARLPDIRKLRDLLSAQAEQVTDFYYNQIEQEEKRKKEEEEKRNSRIGTKREASAAWKAKVRREQREAQKQAREQARADREFRRFTREKDRGPADRTRSKTRDDAKMEE